MAKSLNGPSKKLAIPYACVYIKAYCKKGIDLDLHKYVTTLTVEKYKDHAYFMSNGFALQGQKDFVFDAQDISDQIRAFCSKHNVLLTVLANQSIEFEVNYGVVMMD